VIVAGGMATISMALGLIANSFSLFIVPVSAELGFTRGQMSANQTIFAAGMMLVSLFWGAIFSRFRLKRLMGIAAAVSCVVYFLYAVARALWAFYAISVILSISMALLGWMPFTVIVGNWFTKKRGFALGLTFMGSGVGGMIFNSLGGYLIASVGWRSTIMIYALILTLVMLPVVLFVIHAKPQDMGLSPYGGDDDVVLAAEAEAGGLTLREAARGGRFYAIAASVAILGFAMNSLNVTIAPHMQSLKYSSMFAANVAAAYMAALAVGKFSLGALSDRLGARKACTLALGSLLTAFIAMIFAGFLPVVPLLVLSSGFGNSFGSVAYPLITRQVYGDRDYAAITGIISSLNSLGSAVGPAVCGAIFDASGSYTPGYIAMAGLVAAFGGVLLMAMGRERRGERRGFRLRTSAR
jgi:MFS family permease